MMGEGSDELPFVGPLLKPGELVKPGTALVAEDVSIYSDTRPESLRPGIRISRGGFVTAPDT